MEEEQQSIKFSHLFYSLLVFTFAWGSMWVGSHGLEISLNRLSNIQGQKANIITTGIADNIPNNPTPIPTSTTTSNTSRLRVMIGGDVMLDRGIRLLGKKYGYDSLFASTTSLFKSADIVVVNLEGPITSNKSKTVLANGKTNNSLTFTFEPKTAKTLADAGITLVSLANNHTDNFGRAGLNETKKWLSEANVGWFGDPSNSTSTESIVLKNDISVAFVGYHAFKDGFDRVLKDISSLKEQGYFVIVMPHWGEEYATSSSPIVRSQARQLVLAGARAIIGAHPHVVLEKAWIGDVPVFYSVGNLLFDQNFSPEVMKGNIVELNLIKDRDLTKIEKVKIYETSLASRKGIGLNPEPVDF